MPEMFKCKKEKELERLLEIRELMHRPDYKTMREEYRKAKQEIFDKMDELTAEVEELDIQMEEQLYRKYNGRIPAEESKKMCEELERKRATIEASPEYKVLQERLGVLLREHLLLDESNGYYLTKEEQEEARAGLSLGGSDFFVPADEFVDFLAEDGEALVGETKEELEARFSDVFTAEEIGFQQELASCVIDDVIEGLQAEDCKEAEAKEEFQGYRTLFQELLDTGEEPLFTTVCCEPEDLRLAGEYPINELKMEHLAGLGFDQVLRIVREDRR